MTAPALLTESEAAQALQDLLAYGIYITRDGVRIDPRNFYPEPPEHLTGEA